MKNTIILLSVFALFFLSACEQTELVEPTQVSSEFVDFDAAPQVKNGTITTTTLSVESQNVTTDDEPVPVPIPVEVYTPPTLTPGTHTSTISQTQVQTQSAPLIFAATVKP